MKKRTIIILLCLICTGVVALAAVLSYLGGLPGDAKVSEPASAESAGDDALVDSATSSPHLPSVPAIAPSSSPASSAKPSARVSPSASATPAATRSPTPAPTPSPAAASSPTPAPTPTPALTSAPTPELTPSPAFTPAPTPEPTPTPALTPPPTSEPTPEPTQYVPTSADASAYVGSSVYSLYAAIGYPTNGSSYASSCLGEGEDGELYYGGFTVYTYRSNGSETVTAVF